tara:strand:+ start:4266 stop:4493 length:228 start_codon:yes stop_codon:yes gene_type:complete
MENIFVIAGFISVLFLIIKFIEMRFVLKEDKPLKLLVSDTIIVYLSIVGGHFLYQQVIPDKILEHTTIFTGNPDF